MVGSRAGCSYFQGRFCAMLNNIPCMAADRKMRRFLFDSLLPFLPSPFSNPHQFWHSELKSLAWLEGVCGCVCWEGTEGPSREGLCQAFPSPSACSASVAGGSWRTGVCEGRCLGSRFHLHQPSQDQACSPQKGRLSTSVASCGWLFLS